MKDPKDQAYWERNQLVSALSKLYPSFLDKHPEKDKEWETDWRTIVYIYVPTPQEQVDYNHVRLDDGKWYYQLSWHIHDFDVPLFDHLKYNHPRPWDGHSTEEKYKRLRNFLKF